MKRCNNCFELYETEYKACPHCGYIEGNPPKELFHLFSGMELADRYIVGEILGFGGFGITYKAWDKKLETVTAVKEYYPSGIVNRTPGEKDVVIYAKKREGEFYFGKERFLEEAKNMAKFNSDPNIINVFEYFEENNTAYIVMEFLDGISLKSYLQNNGGKLNVDSALQIIDSISSALMKIHSKGIIHRDVSPDNIFLCANGTIKLIDFGAARFSQDENKLMTIILKPGFAPPEQYEKINKQGPWTDVYALGATFYYIITGKKPEESTNRKINDTLFYPHELDSEIPEYISNAIMKAAAVDVNLRFKDVQQFVNALHQQKTVLPVDVEKKKRKRMRNIGVLAASLLILLGITVSVFMWNSEREEETLPDSTIVMWYCKSGYSELDMAEEQAYNTVIEEFRTSFPNVNIELTGFDKDDYSDAFKNNSAKPNIYEWDGTVSSDTPLSLEKIYHSSEIQNNSLLSYAENYYGSFNYLPLGFDAPVLFSGSQDKENTGSSISSLGEILGSSNESEIFVNDYTDLAKMFSEAGAYYHEDAKEIFFSGSAAYFGTMTDEYINVRNQMPGQYTILSYDTDNIYCRYSNVWAANDIDRNENKAVIKLLEFMLNSNAQDIIHIQNQSENLPINDDVLEVFVTVNNDFEGFFDNKDKYVFEK